MDWDLSRFISGVSLGRLGAKEVYSAGHGKDIFGLFSGLIRPEYPKGETPQLGATFINQFLKVSGDFPVDFRPLGWVHFTDKSWWVEWLDLFLSNSGLYCNRWGYTIRLRLYSMASRRVTTIFMTSWNIIIL